MVRWVIIALVGLTLLSGTVCAQVPAQGQQPPLPDTGPAALLYVRFPGPPGVRITVYPNNSAGQEFNTPITIGFRPGYIYRFKFTNYPEFPGVSFYPTLEVHGSVKLAPPLRAVSYPAPFVVYPDDLTRTLDGTVIMKLVYLEDPEKALPQQGDKDRPVEAFMSADRDLMDEARQLGRPMLIWRIGNKEIEDAELLRKAIPNTVLLPGEQRLGLPPVAPFLPLISAKYVDPILGAKPLSEECLRDGGDRGARASVDRNGQLYGLDPEDTVAEYRDSQGDRKLAVSNTVCLCVPRFGILRTEYGVASNLGQTALITNQLVNGPQRLRSTTPPVQTTQTEIVVNTVGREKPSETHNQQGLSAVARVQGPAGLDNVTGTVGMSAVCQQEPRTLEKPLTLMKWSDCKETQVVDVVTFYIKYSNGGGRPITDVVVNDSLTGRLEYIPGSAEASRPAVFTTQPNEAGSTILRWEIKGQLKPGESGTVRFQARVR